MALANIAQLIAATSGAYDILIENSGSDPLYIGYALPGTLTTVAGWKITMVTGGGTPTEVRHANGTSKFDKKWSLRTTYNYTFA